MDETLEALMRQVIDDLELSVLGGQAPAVVRYEGRVSRQMSDDTYWAKADIPARFERRAAELSVEDGVRRFVFGVPLVMVDTEVDTHMRAPFPPARSFETEIVWLLGCDVSQGIEIGRVDVDRTGGVTTFGPLYVMVGEQTMLDGCPGFLMLQQVMAAD